MRTTPQCSVHRPPDCPPRESVLQLMPAWPDQNFEQTMFLAAQITIVLKAERMREDRHRASDACPNRPTASHKFRVHSKLGRNTKSGAHPEETGDCDVLVPDLPIA